MSIFDNKEKFATVSLTLLLTTSLSGCHSYLARQEAVTSFAGETLAHNEAISVVDTWPDGFDDTDVSTDGKRQSDAVKHYKNAHKKKPAAPPTIKIVADQ